MFGPVDPQSSFGENPPPTNVTRARRTAFGDRSMVDCNRAPSGQIRGVIPLLVLFALGVTNFALHKAVLESGHPAVRQMPRPLQTFGRRATLLAEFAVLLGAMLLVAKGFAGWGWAYSGYTAINAVAAWLILTRRL